MRTQLPYEFLFRWKDDGTPSGGHVVFRNPDTGLIGLPKPVGSTDKVGPNAFPLEEIGVILNEAILAHNAQLQKENAEHLATIEALKSTPPTDLKLTGSTLGM